MKPNNWQIKHYIVSGIFAALTFAVAFLLGTGIILATGIPATGGILNIFAAVFVVTIGLKIVPKFGFATLTLAIMFTIAIPTVIGGPPGLYKVIDGIIIGLFMDTILIIGYRKKYSYFLAGSIGAIISILTLYFALIILELPGVEKLTPLLKYLVPLQAITGFLGTWAGISIFKKRLKNISAIQRLMN
jgi:hypothetical protein